MTSKEMMLKWIYDKTEGHETVVEFGAMFGYRLQGVNKTVKNKIGIEIWKPYIDANKVPNITMIHGDMRKYEELVKQEFMDCATFIDTLEHLDKSDALDLLGRVKKDFKKIVLIIPEGIHQQNKDVTGYGAHDSQTHKSYWSLKEIEDLGFETLYLPTFFPKQENKTQGCIFGVWSKN